MSDIWGFEICQIFLSVAVVDPRESWSKYSMRCHSSELGESLENLLR